MAFRNKSFRSVQTPGNLNNNVNAWCISAAISHNIVELNSLRCSLQLHFQNSGEMFTFQVLDSAVDVAARASIRVAQRKQRHFQEHFLSFYPWIDMNRGQSIPAAHASMNHHSCPGRALARLQFAWPRKIKVIKLHWSGLSTLDDRKKRRAGRKPSSKKKTGLWWLLGKRFIDIIITQTKKVHPKLNYWIVRFSPFHCNHVRSILPSFSSFNFLRASLNPALPCLVMSGQDDKIIGRSSIKWDVQKEQTEHGNDNGKVWWWMGK